MTWKTLLTGNEAVPYKNKLAEIAGALMEHTEKMGDNIGLMGGKIGTALFFFYYYRLTNEEKYADFAVNLISEIFDQINNDFSYHTHAGGLAGIGWTIEHLAQNEFIDTDTNEVLEALDPYLSKTMIFDIQNGNYDFLHGAVGNGAYFLNRAEGNRAPDYLEALIDHLDTISHKDDDDARKWESELNHEVKQRGYNLSLSHGIASIIVFLSKAVKKGINLEKSRELLDGAVKYLLKFKLDRTQFISNFPSWISEGEPLAHSRLAWCYGDLGISLALATAGRNADNPEWQKIALDVLVDSTCRKDIKENMVIDAGLCHGVSGIMHIYNRGYQTWGHESLKETTLYWADHLLKYAQYPDGYAGYKAWHTEKHGGWQPEAGFLEGITGIGLSIISLISDIEPKWDESLFIS